MGLTGLSAHPGHRLKLSSAILVGRSLAPTAEVAELADAQASGACARKGVGVRIPLSAPLLTATKQLGSSS